MESILDFSQPLNIEILDQLLKKQHENKVSLILNQFIQNPLSLSKVGEILKSNNSENIRFFGLAVLEKQLSLLNQQQCELIVKDLMIMVLDDTTTTTTATTQTSSLKGLLRKKSASLISQILIKEWLNNNNITFVENNISQLLNFINDNQNQNQLIMIEGIFNIFKNLASFIQNQIQDNQKFTNLETIFNLIFKKSYQSLQIYEKQQQNSSNSSSLINEILNTIGLMWPLLSLEYLYSTDLLYLVSNIENELNSINIKNSFIQVLYEHINTVVVKSSGSGSGSGSNSSNIEFISIMFKNIVEKCSKLINNTKNKNGILFENIAMLFTVYLENYYLIFENIKELNQVFNYSQEYIIEILPSIPSDRSIESLQFLNLLFKSLQQQQQQTQQQSNRLSIYTKFIPILFSSIFKILNNHNEEELEENGKGILYDIIGGDSTSSTSTSASENNEEWNKISNLISEILYCIGSIYFNDSFQFFTSKLKSILTNPTTSSENSSKLGTVFWCIGNLCKYSNQFETINQFLGELINSISSGGSGGDQQTIMMGILFVIRNSTSYLKNSQNTQSIKELIVFITDKLLPLLASSSTLASTTSSSSSSSLLLLDMTIHTIEVIIEIRDYLIQSIDYPNYHQHLSQTILMIQSKLSPLQINKLYECIGKLIFIQANAARSQLQAQDVEIISSILQPLIDKLKSCNLDNDNDRNTINNILHINVSLAKTMKSYFKLQMVQLSPILIQLFNWSNQQGNNGIQFEKYSGSIFSFKKNIIELINYYLLFNSTNESTNTTAATGDNNNNNNLQNEILKYSELLYNDPTINLQVYKNDVLPKTLMLITTIINTFKSNLSKQFVDLLFLPFFNLSLQEAAQQLSTTGKGLILLNKIWELIKSTLLINPILLVGKISNYIELINYCIGNISPSIHNSAFESLINYFSNIQSVPNEIVIQLFNFELLFKEFEIILNLLLKSEYQSSIDKIIKLLFIIIKLSSNNQEVKIGLMKTFKEKYTSLVTDTILTQLFDNSNNFEMFENYIKPICKQ